MSRRSLQLTSLLALLLLATACNIDSLSPVRRSPRGPLVNLDRGPSVARSTLAADIAVVDPQEVDLVEDLLTYRIRYHESLGRLRDYYEQHGHATKLSWAEYEQMGLRTVKPFRYLLDAEIPSDRLRPTEDIPEAQALYAQGVDLMRRGGYDLPGLYSQKLFVEAAQTLRELVERYPSSEKIDDAAFMLGEIHRELPNQELIAAKWYERAWTWNPDTPYPARYQAAVLCDYRLRDRARALELYRKVLAEETGDDKNVASASRRIRILTIENSPVGTEEDPG